MKRLTCYLSVVLAAIYLCSCAPPGHYSDPFYNFNDSDFPKVILPVIDPIDAVSLGPTSPWELGLGNDIWIQIPNSNNAYYAYSGVGELEKFAVKNGVIMAYSSYVDKQAEAYIQNNFYHWFVIIPDKNITKGFQTEEEFDQYIQTLGIQNPDWQTPDEAYKKFAQTGCLDWIPDCK
ncbi:MAG TPA: hypothetical protein VIN60_09240 [Anaerolineales bacterium]